MDARRQRRNQSVPVHRHVHRRWQHLDRRRHPRHHVRGDPADLSLPHSTGRHDINAFHRRIHTQAVMTAVAVSTACLMLVTVVSMALMIITGCSLCDALFDTCSAFGLGGYSVGVASESSPRCYTFSPQPCSSGVSDRSPSPTRFRVHTISRPSAYPTEQIVVG